VSDKTEHAVRAVSGVSSVLREVTHERDALRADNEWLKVAVQRKTEEVETAMSEVVRLRAAIRAYLENDSQANWDALAALVPE